MRNDQDRVLDILEAIGKIVQEEEKGKELFLSDEHIQVWMIYHIQIIGEAAAKLSPELLQLYSEIEWQDIISMRNILVHEYFGINQDIIWATVEHDIPALQKKMQNIINNYNE